MLLYAAKRGSAYAGVFVSQEETQRAGTVETIELRMDTQENVRYVCMLSGEWSSLYMIEEECVIRTNSAGPFWGRCIQDCSRAV